LFTDRERSPQAAAAAAAYGDADRLVDQPGRFLDPLETPSVTAAVRARRLTTDGGMARHERGPSV